MSREMDWEHRVFGVLTELAAGATTVSLYGPDHPRAAQSVQRLGDHLDHLLSSEANLSLVVIGEELFAQGQPITRSCRQAPSLLRRFRRRRIEVVSVASGVTPDELRRFLVDLAVTDDVPFGDYAHISVGLARLTERELGGPDDRSGGRAAGSMGAVRDRVEVLFECLETVRRDGTLAVPTLETIADKVLAGVARAPDPLRQMAPWRGEDRWLAVHAHNTCVLSMAMASRAGVGALPGRELGVAALTHHLGKLRFPAELWEKELELRGEELELILDHSIASLEALLEVPAIPPLALVVAFEHHLHFNGAGYPRLPHPRRPHPASRLISLASSASILLTLRVERGTTTREETAGWLRARSGTVFDPLLTEAIVELVAADVGPQLPG